MCDECWDDHGRPQIDTPAVRAAAEAIKAVYDIAPAGGYLHVAIDDWNLDCLDWCRKQLAARASGDDDYTDEEIEIQRQCGEALAALTEKEQASALALHDGFWSLLEGAPAGGTGADS